MNKILEIFSYELNQHVVLNDTYQFCKQLIIPQIKFATTVNGENVKLCKQKYKSIINCENDKYLTVANLKLFSKIQIKSMHFFSQYISHDRVVLEKIPSNDIVYILANGEIVDSINVNSTEINCLDKYNGNIIMYRPQLDMEITKIEINTHNMINSWTIESIEIESAKM
jgi:hypothetical protein